MTASTDQKPTATKNSSRRALLAGALGGIGAVVAGAVAKVSPVRAGVDGDVVLGATNNSTLQTLINNSSSGGNAFVGLATSGIGLAGLSSNNYGVYGASTTSAGVYGDSSASTGLLGSSGTSPAPKPKTGVYGYAVQDGSSRGVWGETQTGQGVRGQATSGTGVYGRAWASGHALHLRGRFKAEQISGVATIPAGSTGVTVNPGVNLNSGSFVLLTPKANIGSRSLWFTTNASANTFRIRINNARTSATKIAWLLLG